MANATTLTNLQDQALNMADMTASGFPVTARLTEDINDGLAELHDILVNAGADWLKSSTDVTITSGTAEYDLPSDFYRLLAAYYKTEDRLFKLERFSPHNIDGYRTTPLSGGTAELWYAPTVTLLVAGGDTVMDYLPLGWERYAARHAAIQLLIREESDPRALQQQNDRLKARIIQMCEPRDDFQGEGIADVSERWQSGEIEVDEEHYFRYALLGDKIRFVQTEYFGAQ